MGVLYGVCLGNPYQTLQFSAVLLRMHWMGVVRLFPGVRKSFAMILCQMLPWTLFAVFIKFQLRMVSTFTQYRYIL